MTEPLDLSPMVPCPGCGAEYEDFDGFGVLHCNLCGYCAHPSISDGVCDYCGKLVYPESQARWRV